MFLDQRRLNKSSSTLVNGFEDIASPFFFVYPEETPARERPLVRTKTLGMFLRSLVVGVPGTLLHTTGGSAALAGPSVWTASAAYFA